MSDRIKEKDTFEKLKTSDDFFLLLRHGDDFSIITKTDDSGDNIFSALHKKNYALNRILSYLRRVFNIKCI